MVLTLLGYCVAIAAASLLGGALPLVALVNHTRMHVALSLAAGVMLGAVFFHMLPEAVEAGGVGTLSWTCGGLLALFFLERYFSFHQHASPEFAQPTADRASTHVHLDHAHALAHGVCDHPRESAELHWGVAAFGLAIHTLVGGFALASAVAAGRASDRLVTSWGVFLATFMHKPADSLTIVSLMIRAGASRGMTHLVNLGYALLVPMGVACFFPFREWTARASEGAFTSSALAFSAGTFLCIALSDLLPELQFHKHDRLALSIALLAGVALMALSALFG